MHFLRIRPEQMKAFQEDGQRRFLEREIDRVRATHALDAKKARAVVEHAVSRGTALGIDEEADVMTLMDWYAVRGVGFDERPEYARVRKTLEDRTLPGWARLRFATKQLEQP